MGFSFSNNNRLYLPNEVDCYLGPSEKRYFGENYKRISHNISGLKVINDRISGNLRIDWPNCWSEKGGMNLQPHIGTLDFFVIAFRFVELHLHNVENIDFEEMNNMWISEIVCHSNKCIEKNNIVCCCSMLSSLCHEDIIIYEYEILIDIIKVRLKISHNNTKKNSSLLRVQPYCSTHNESFFIDGYKSYRLNLKNISLNLDELYIHAYVESNLFETAKKYNGVTQFYMPCFTYCDLIIAAGQLSQILIFKVNCTTREKSGNLWMRQIKCKYKTPIRNDTFLKVNILGSKVINLRGEYYNAVDLYFDFNDGDLIAECKAAYKIQ